MKKLTCILSLVSCFLALPVAANVMFGDAQNQFKILGGYAVSETEFEKPSKFAMLEYAQPVTFLRLDSRINLHTGLAANGDNDWGFVGGSLDVALLSLGNFYAGAGIGAFYRSAATPRLDSRFTFGQRVFIGYKITQRWTAEAFAQHFSNGDITDRNLGYNFAGIGVVWSF